MLSSISFPFPSGPYCHYDNRKPVRQLQGGIKREHTPAERGEVTQQVGSKKGKMMCDMERGENRKPQCLFFL